VILLKLFKLLLEGLPVENKHPRTYETFTQNIAVKYHLQKHFT